MEKEFLPYKEALELKELGFDEPCFGFHSKIHGLMMVKTSGSSSLYKDAGECLAPTYSQAFRWFREKHNIHAEITWSPSYEYEPGKWSDAIYEITFVDVSYTKEWKAESPDMQRGEGKQLTYEEAEFTCLDELIEIVETKQQEQ